MDLHLDDEESALLREILDSVYRDLSYEIADTDNSAFRERLKQRRDTVGRILALVGGPLADRPF